MDVTQSFTVKSKLKDQKRKTANLKYQNEKKKVYMPK